MPFRRVPGSKSYESESGRKYTPAQMRLYYATAGFTKPKKQPKLRKLQ